MTIVCYTSTDDAILLSVFAGIRNAISVDVSHQLTIHFEDGEKWTSRNDIHREITRPTSSERWFPRFDDNRHTVCRPCRPGLAVRIVQGSVSMTTTTTIRHNAETSQLTLCISLLTSPSSPPRLMMASWTVLNRLRFFSRRLRSNRLEACEVHLYSLRV